ncbi:DUF302 domain-containing protein [Eudoraea chungangensis]|uniref:DUF302 domain-containing protein n=1 Tax=Eudoraea chungangensis TaxID=1481905 RepID=UPI0023EDE910|nr:DUF302 domain-containing protein [Eudoraea chungangensis]
MKNIISTLILGSIFFCTSCGQNSKNKNTIVKEIGITGEVDKTVKKLGRFILPYSLVVSLDHHRMAAEAGVYTPPSIATIFSDAEIDVAIIKEKQLTALDLPFKVLCYTEADTSSVKIAYTSAEFIQKRHQLADSILFDYNAAISKIISSFPLEMISKTDVSNVQEGFGIVSIKSDFNYAVTIQNLKNIVMSQGDTKWFADIDYQKEAASLDVELRPTTLLLFGGPAPGGKAMVSTPKIGLDAFCQKLLVYENEHGEVWVAYNDIVAFSNLYYKTSTKPQQLINQRLKMTFTKAITNPPVE